MDDFAPDNLLAPDDLKTYPLKSFFSELFKVIILGAFAVVAIRYFVFKPFVVKGASMEPNFREKEYLIIDELTYRLNEPQRGDIVVLRNQGQDDHDYFLKRVVALPGERIVIMNGRVKIYNAPHTGGKFLDENRPASLDSRRIGPVARSEIVGRAFLRGWPLSRIEYLAKDYARD